MSDFEEQVNKLYILNELEVQISFLVKLSNFKDYNVAEICSKFANSKLLKKKKFFSKSRNFFAACFYG